MGVASSPRGRVMSLRILLLLAFALCVPAAASAVTLHDIIELSKAGLPDDVLVAVIDADRTIFTLDKDQILELKKAGVSNAVLLKMIRTRREFEPAATEATAPVATTTTADVPQPGVVVIGVDTKPEPPPPPTQYYYVPYPIWGSRPPRVIRPAPPFMPGERSFGRFINDGWIGPR